jgi:GWxTD domain-containing protein
MPGKIFSILIALLISVTWPIFSSHSQDILPVEDFSGRGGYYLDYAQFKSDHDDLNRLEIYYKIFNSNLQFIRKGRKFQADYELTLTVYDNDGRQIMALSRDRSYAVPDYERTVSTDDFRVSQFNLLLSPGKYKTELHLLNKNSGSDIGRTIKSNLVRYDNRGPMLSGIELAQMVDSTATDSPFVKRDIMVIPSVNRVYSGDSTANLLYYYEIYQGTEKYDEIVVKTQIHNRKMDIVFRDSLITKLKEGENVIRYVREISLYGFRSGEYTLNIALYGRRNRKISKTTASFSIYWSPEAMVRHDFEKAVSQLKYIAEKEEIDKLKSAVSSEERMTLWNKFWAVRDPSPGTPENETRRNYYNRIEYANRYYRIMKKEGWQADRGMILIKFGEPDHIEDFPFELDSKAYVIWYYYHMKNPRKFIFVDEWDDGDYQLQYPYDGRM